jgi:FeS assembly SUF system protein
MSIVDWLHRREGEGVVRDDDMLRAAVIDVLRTVYDPEIPVNIYDLGLIYGIDVDAATGRVDIRMTLTAPNCPVAETFPGTVEELVRTIDGVEDVHVELVWEPRWGRELMSETALLELGLL